MIRKIFAVSVISIIILSSCQTEIDIISIIDNNAPIVLITKSSEVNNDSLPFQQKDTIEINSEKWDRLKEFAKNNMRGWRTSPASYISDFYITQDEFRFLGWINGDGIVIGFIDLEGKAVQYSKEIKLGELDFLLE